LTPLSVERKKLREGMVSNDHQQLKKTTTIMKRKQQTEQNKKLTESTSAAHGTSTTAQLFRCDGAQRHSEPATIC
jgi:hypothetical protein